MAAFSGPGGPVISRTSFSVTELTICNTHIVTIEPLPLTMHLQSSARPNICVPSVPPYAWSDLCPSTPAKDGS